MQMCSACSGPCSTCKVSMYGSCLAGHGDDDCAYASPEWIKSYKAFKEKEARAKEDKAKEDKIIKNVKEFYDRKLDSPKNWQLRDAWLKRINAESTHVGRPTNNPKYCKVTARISSSVYEVLLQYSEDNDITISTALRDILDMGIKTLKKHK